MFTTLYALSPRMVKPVLKRPAFWIAVAWCALALVGVVVLREFDPADWWGRSFARAFFGHVLRLGLATFLFVSSAAIGDAVLGISRRKRRGGAREAAPLWSLRVALGLTLLCVVLFGLAAWQLWRPPVFWTLFAIQAAFLIRCAAGGNVEAHGDHSPRAAQIRRRFRLWLHRLRRPEALAGIALAGVYILPSLLSALAPPVGWDDQVYHLPLPKAYLAHGGFFAMSWNFFAQQPGMSDLLYGWALALGDGMVAALVHFGLGITTCIGLWEVARRMGFRRAAWFAPALFLCHFMVGEEMGWAFNDVAMAAFLVPAWWVLWSWARGRTGPYGWFVAGLVGGMIVASKYTGVLFIVGIGLWTWIDGMLARRWREDRRTSASAPGNAPAPGRLFLGVVGFGMVGALMIVPWFVKNAVFAGNPVWPLLYSVFGGKDWNAHLSRALIAWQHGDYGFGRSPLDCLLLIPRLFFQSDYTPGHFAGSLAVLPLAGSVAGLVFLTTDGRRRTWIPTSAFLILLGLWATGSQQSRFLIPALPLLALGALPAVDAALVPRRLPRWRSVPLVLCLIAALVANLYGTALPRWKSAGHNTHSMLLGRDPLGPYLRVRVAAYDCFQHIESLPEPDRGDYVLLLFAPMGYHANFPYRFDTVIASPYLDLACECGNGNALAREFASMGVRLVVIDRGILDEMMELAGDAPPQSFLGGDKELAARYRKGLDVVVDFMRNHATEVFRGQLGVSVYRVKP